MKVRNSSKKKRRKMHFVSKTIVSHFHVVCFEWTMTANYVVLQLQVIHVDTVTLAEAKTKEGGNETSGLPGWIQWCLELIGTVYRQKIEGDYCKYNVDFILRVTTITFQPTPSHFQLLCRLCVAHFFWLIVPNLVMQQLATEMPKLLEKKMEKKKVKAETEVLKEKNQARFFYAKLKEIRAEEETRKEKNPIRKMRKRMTSSSSSDDDTDSSSSDDE